MMESRDQIYAAELRRGSRATTEFVRKVLIPETALFADARMATQVSRKRPASVLGPNFSEPPTKKRKLGTKFWEIYRRCLNYVDSQLKHIGFLLGDRLRVTGKLTQGFEDAMSWEQEMSRSTLSDPRRPGIYARSCPRMMRTRRWRCS